MRATDPCNCRVECMDADDEEGVCKGLPEPPRVPLVELVLVDRAARPEHDDDCYAWIAGDCTCRARPEQGSDG